MTNKKEIEKPVLIENTYIFLSKVSSFNRDRMIFDNEFVHEFDSRDVYITICNYFRVAPLPPRGGDND